MEKIPVYFVPGMAASPLIFEYIKLPEDRFEMFFLEWMMPNDGETLKQYSARMAGGIKHDNPVLIGVSLGGLVVQEMADVIKTRKVIIISSAKCNKEFPRRMKFAKLTKIYKTFPTRMIQNVDAVRKLFPGNNVLNRRLDLYEKYLAVRDKKYLDWAFKVVIEWDREVPNPDVVHVHGDADGVFPVRYIKNYVPVKGGTHIMIINRFSWMNEHLPGLILK
jgi:pimeloyl-ACP methyl ester carboxylesterase